MADLDEMLLRADNLLKIGLNTSDKDKSHSVLAQAVNLYIRYLNVHHSDSAALTNFSTACIQLEKPDIAILKLGDIINRSLFNLTAYSQMGRAFIEQSKYEEALLVLSLGMQQDPNDEAMVEYMATSLMGLERFGEALSYLAQQASKNQLNPVLRYNMGYAQLKLGMLDEAVLNFDAAMQLGLNHHAIYHYKGLALLKAKRPDKAIDTLRQVISTETHPLTLLYLADAYLDIGDSARAKSAYIEVVGLINSKKQELEPLDYAIAVQAEQGLQRTTRIDISTRYLDEAIAKGILPADPKEREKQIRILVY